MWRVPSQGEAQHAPTLRCLPVRQIWTTSSWCHRSTACSSRTKADTQLLAEIKDSIDDHATWINGLGKLIFMLQKAITSITVQAVDNDNDLKKSIASTDATLKENLRQMEMIVTQQGADHRSLSEIVNSGAQAMDAKYGEAMAALEGAVRGLREETPVRLTEVRSAVTAMNETVTRKISAIETAMTMQAGAPVASAPPGFDGNTLPGATQGPPGFSQAAEAQAVRTTVPAGQSPLAFE